MVQDGGLVEDFNDCSWAAQKLQHLKRRPADEEKEDTDSPRLHAIKAVIINGLRRF